MAADDAHHRTGRSRRSFLTTASMVMGGVAIGAGVWGLNRAMGPTVDIYANNKRTLDLSGIPPGDQIVVNYFGMPVFIRHRTEQQVAEAQAVDLDKLRDPFANNRNLSPTADASDKNRSGSLNDRFIIVLANCTHRGCVPTFEECNYGGWFCMCCASHYDLAGRVRRGLAPRNLSIPHYVMTSPNTLDLIAGPSQYEIDRLIYG